MRTETRCHDALADLRDRLVRLARTKGLSKAEAEDVAQETLVRALVSNVLDQSFLPAWTTVVARNLCSDQHRSMARIILSPDVIARGEAETVSMMETVEDTLSARRIEGLVNKLPSPQREVIEGLGRGQSIAQIAQSRGASKRSIEAHLLRARRRLRRCLVESG